LLDFLNPLNAELNPICHLLALLGAHHIFNVSGLKVKYDTSGFVVLDAPMKYVLLSSQARDWTALKASLSVQCPFSFVLF
jgi:hypothetical protein